MKTKQLMKYMIAGLVLCSALPAQAKPAKPAKSIKQCAVTMGVMVLSDVKYANDQTGDLLTNNWPAKLRFPANLPVKNELGTTNLVVGQKLRFTTGPQNAQGYCVITSAELVVPDVDKKPFNSSSLRRGIQVSHAKDCGYARIGQRPVCIK